MPWKPLSQGRGAVEYNGRQSTVSEGDALRALILSDIHSNLEAFNAVLQDAEETGGFDQIWGLGDLVGYGPDPVACIELLWRYDHVSVAGNHDLAASGGMDTDNFNSHARLAARWTASQLSGQHTSYLLSMTQVLRMDPFTLVHGSLRAPVYEYLVSIEAAMGTFSRLESPFCLVGHSHIPFVCREAGALCRFDPFPEDEDVALGEDRLIVNPGGVGQPRDGDYRPSYAVYDDILGTLRRRRVSYPVDQTQQKMRRAGLPDALIRRLSHGL